MEVCIIPGNPTRRFAIDKTDIGNQIVLLLYYNIIQYLFLATLTEQSAVN